METIQPIDAGVHGINGTQWTCCAGCTHATRFDARYCVKARAFQASALARHARKVRK